MKVHRLAQELDLHGIPAAVVVVLGVERLMDVAHEVNQEDQSLSAISLGVGRIPKDAAVMVDRCDSAFLIDAIARRVVRFVERNVDEVERSSLRAGRAPIVRQRSDGVEGAPIEKGGGRISSRR